MNQFRAPVRWAMAAAVAAFAALTLLVHIGQGAPVSFLLVDTALGMLFIAAGVIAWERRPEARSGPLLLASGALWHVGGYAPTSIEPAALIGFAFERYYDVLLALLVLTFPAMPLGRAGKLVLGVLAGAFVLRSAARLLVGCTCIGTASPLALVSDDALFGQLQALTSAVVVAAAIGVAALAWQRLQGARGSARRILRPVVAAGILAAMSAAYDAFEMVELIVSGDGLWHLSEPWQELVGWLPFAAVVLVPLGFLAGSLRLRLAHGPIAPLAVEIDRGADTAQLERALQHALGDASLVLLVRDRDADGWLDARGHAAPPPVEVSGRAVTYLERDGRPLAAVIHDPTLREDPGLVAAASAVLRLAIENERLNGDVRQQLGEVRASRARLVEAAEVERTRIERDLHDGAQQRLLGVAMTLQQARDEARREAPGGRFLRALDDASEMLLAAIDELRETARGIHPAVLTDEGLGTAVASLARRAAVPVEVEMELTDRLPPAVEAAAYYVVAEALTNVTRHARASLASVRITRRDGRLEVEVADDGDGGADASRGSGLRGLTDRLAAVDGTLLLDSPAQGGTRLRAVIPCA